MLISRMNVPVHGIQGALVGEEDASAWGKLIISADLPSNRVACHAISESSSSIGSQEIQQEGGNKKASVHTILHLIQ